MREEGSRHKGKGVKVIVREALEHYGGPFKVGEGYTGPKPIVLGLLLDSHWFGHHVRSRLMYRRELMGSDKIDVSDPQLRLGVFISRTLWSWPGCLEEIVPFVKLSLKLGLIHSSKTTHQSHRCLLDWDKVEARIMEVPLKPQLQV
jgi:hypothetical protein